MEAPWTTGCNYLLVGAASTLLALNKSGENSTWPMLITTNKGLCCFPQHFFLSFFFFLALCLNQYLEKKDTASLSLELFSQDTLKIEICSPGWNQLCICFITVASVDMMKQGKSLGSFSKQVLKLSFKRRCFILEQCLVNFFL